MPDAISEYDLDALAARVDAAATGALDADQVDQAMTLTEEEWNEAPGAARMAFQYTDGRTDGEGFFRERFGFKDGTAYPPPLRSLPPDVRAIWEGLALRVSSPVARARLHDLCFDGRFDHGGDHARAAADAYLEMSAVDPYSLEDEADRLRVNVGRLGWLRRGLQLAKLMKNQDLVDKATDAILAAAAASLDQPDLEPGVSLGHLETLIDLRVDRPKIDELLRRARHRYVGEDAHHVSATIALQLRRANSDEDRRQLHEEIVTAWIDHAERFDPLVRMHFLEQAAQLARNYGLTELEARATTMLQGITIDTLGLVKQSVSVPFPAEALEAHLKQFTDAPTWQDALLLLVQVCPSGNAEANRVASDEIAESTPFLSLVPRVRLGGDGLPRYTASTEEERRELRIVEHEMSLLGMNAIFVVEALRRIFEKWGAIPTEDLTTFLAQREHVRQEVAAALARGFRRFFDGDHEGAAFTIAPRVETVARELLLKLDQPVYRTQRVNNPGQYPGLGVLFAALGRNGLDESWARFLHGYLSSPIGKNARNELSHGFVDEVDETTAALVLLAALYLTVGIATRAAESNA